MLANKCLAKVMIVSFCGQHEVMTPRSRTWCLLYLIFLNSFVGVLVELGRNGELSPYRPSRTPRRTNASMRCLSEVVSNPHGPHQAGEAFMKRYHSAQTIW